VSHDMLAVISQRLVSGPRDVPVMDRGFLKRKRREQTRCPFVMNRHRSNR
jgi:hypothetical protein